MTKIKDIVSFEDFCEIHLNVEIQPWQRKIIEKISQCEGEFLILDPRRQSHSLKKYHRDYLQYICLHEWSEIVLLITPEKSEIVTACVKCQKISNPKSEE